MLKISLALIALTLSITTQAAPVVWKINNAVFDDGATLTGGFTFDESSQSFSDVFMFSTRTSNLMESYYESLYLTSPTVARFHSDGIFVAFGALDLVFSDVLTDAGGIVSISGQTREGCSLESQFGGPSCIDFGEPSRERFLVSGNVSAVPIPAAAWLFGSAMLGLMGVARRKKA